MQMTQMMGEQNMWTSRKISKHSRHSMQQPKQGC